MLSIRRTEEFDTWIRNLRDLRGRTKILVRIERLAAGHLGDVAPVGGGMSEMRIHHGPGYRVYFTRRGETVVILLCGGDKGTQERDIRRAQAIRDALED